jgi:hypothetical protein
MGEVIVDWAATPLLHHLGQNGKNLASIWIEPKRDFAMVLVTNIDTKKANDALYALSADLYRRFGVGKSTMRGRAHHALISGQEAKRISCVWLKSAVYRGSVEARFTR